MFSFIVSLLFVLIILAIIWKVMQLLGLPSPLSEIILLLLALAFLFGATAWFGPSDFAIHHSHWK